MSWRTALLLALAKERTQFARKYEKVLDACDLSFAVCTIYDPAYSHRDRQEASVAGLSVFNDVITRAAVRRGLPVIDLRVLFDDPADYANPIEPSAVGGAKIVEQIIQIVTNHDFRKSHSVFFPNRRAERK